MKASETTLQRRTFVTAAVCAPALAVVALMARKPSVQAPAMPAPAAAATGEPAAQSGYHETDHIRRYYASMNF